VTDNATHIDPLSALSEHQLFTSTTADDLARLVSSGRTFDLMRGDLLFDEGDISHSLYLVLSGRVAIVMTSEIDQRESVIALMEVGDLFGELGLLDDGTRSATARALEPSTVIEIPYEPVRALFEDQPELVWGMGRMLAKRLRVMDEALADSVFLDVTGRTAKRVIDLSEGADEFVLPVTQEELAGMVGASRERVNKAISSFVRLGWLEQHERHYRILQRDRLEQRAR
jgi:CRP/FNR family cyclic AMP-dependent transcriptional regulator